MNSKILNTFFFHLLSSPRRQREPVGLMVLRKTSAWLELDSRTPSIVRLPSLPARKLKLVLAHYYNCIKYKRHLIHSWNTGRVRRVSFLLEPTLARLFVGIRLLEAIQQLIGLCRPTNYGNQRCKPLGTARLRSLSLTSTCSVGWETSMKYSKSRLTTRLSSWPK